MADLVMEELKKRVKKLETQNVSLVSINNELVKQGTYSIS